MAILEVKNLTHTYDKGIPSEKVALDDISFSVKEGEFIGIIGHTGSGKSTLVQHFNGLIKPEQGEIFIQGKNIWEEKKLITKYRFMTGLVFQYPEYQLFEETIFKDIAFGPKNMGLNEEEIKERVLEAAAFTGIKPSMLQDSPFELSGGQKRRVAIAGVMAMRPRILVLDEPAAGLDPKGRKDILNQIKQYHEKSLATIILVSHSMEDIANYADRVLVLNQAKIEMFDSVDRVFEKSDRLLEIGLEVPNITQIFLKLKKQGIDIPANIYSVKQGEQVLKDYFRGGGDL